MIPFGSTILDRAAETVGAYLPRVGAFLALLVLGYLLAAIVGRLVARSLRGVGLDTLSTRLGVDRELGAIGIQRPASRVVGSAVRIAILVVAIVAAVGALGLSALNDSLNATVLFLPKLFAALVLILAGIVAGRVVRERVDRSATRMDLAGPLGPLAQAAIVAVFTTTALAQLSVTLAVLTLIVAIVIGAVCLAAAQAVGLGSRDIARQISAGRTLARSLSVGQRISIGEQRGEIEAFESAAVMLRTSDGLVRLPNHLFLEGVVTIHDDGEAADA
jgi:small-conductance mechanosensitive channel